MLSGRQRNEDAQTNGVMMRKEERQRGGEGRCMRKRGGCYPFP